MKAAACARVLLPVPEAEGRDASTGSVLTTHVKLVHHTRNRCSNLAFPAPTAPTAQWHDGQDCPGPRHSRVFPLHCSGINTARGAKVPQEEATQQQSRCACGLKRDRNKPSAVHPPPHNPPLCGPKSAQQVGMEAPVH